MCFLLHNGQAISSFAILGVLIGLYLEELACQYV